MNHLLFLNVGGSELIIIALFVLMFFGSKSIPEFMRGLGKMTREFKDAMNGLEREVRQSVDLEETTKTTEPSRLNNPSDGPAKEQEEKPEQQDEKKDEQKIN